MADSLNAPMPQLAAHGSAWDPLREPLFRSLWFAAVISYTGTWMQNVGAGWLMTQLTMDPFKVGLVQAATTLPVFLVILPAGALADMVDRRRRNQRQARRGDCLGFSRSLATSRLGLCCCSLLCWDWAR